MLLGVVAAAWLCAAAAPQRAGAFIGEPEVINGETLSKEAESFLKSVEDERKLFEGGGGPPDVPVGDEGGWWGWGEGSGFYPVIGSLASFGVGYGIGQEACENILEPLLGEPYCFGSTSTESSPPVPKAGEGEWQWRNLPYASPGEPTKWYPAPGYAWYWKPAGWSIEPLPWSTYGKYEKGCGFEPPGSQTWFYPEEFGATACGSPAPAYTEKGVLVRGPGGHRTFGPVKTDALPKATGNVYCPVAAPTGCTSKPSSDWSHRAKQCLVNPRPCGLTQGEAGEIGQEIASQIPSGQEAGVASPYAVSVTVPGCRGHTYGWCREHAESDVLTPVKEELTWETADVTVEPEHVVDTRPREGAVVETHTELLVQTNPSAGEMPAVIPEPRHGETYSEYITRLSPSLKPERVNVDSANEDATVGPDVALRTQPVPGTEENPAVSTTVTVYTNPPDAPVPVESGSCNTSIGSVDFSPLNQPLGSKFPFGVFGFFVRWIGEWSSPSTPSWTVTLIPAGTFGSPGLHIHIELASMESVAEVVRIAFLFASFVGLLWFLGTAAARIQGDGS